MANKLDDELLAFDNAEVVSLIDSLDQAGGFRRIGDIAFDLVLKKYNSMYSESSCYSAEVDSVSSGE